MAARLPALLAIVGPTASGKSALALRIAAERQGEIVSCDSLQVYRGLDVGSAKATAAERWAAPHHLLDVVEPDETFSAADYARLARAAIRDVAARARLPIVAGGTGLYLRALLLGLFEGPRRDEALRRRLERIAERFGDGRLHRLLARVDPEAAARLAPADRVRVVRALEVWKATGRPIGVEQRRGAAPLEGFRVGLFGLLPDRRALRQAVDERTRSMMERGLVAETHRLLERFPPRLRPFQAIGYRQAAAVVRGEMTADEAVRSIVTATMRLAKRQVTWFRHQQPGLRWFSDADTAYAAIAAWLDEGPSGESPVPPSS